MPNGQPCQKTPLNKAALQQHQVEHWQKFSSPVYDSELMLDDYHIIRDKGTANFYIDTNKVKGYLLDKQKGIRSFKKMNNRKGIHTFVSLNDNRFDSINKSP